MTWRVSIEACLPASHPRPGRRQSQGRACRFFFPLLHILAFALGHWGGPGRRARCPSKWMWTWMWMQALKVSERGNTRAHPTWWWVWRRLGARVEMDRQPKVPYRPSRMDDMG